MDKKSIQRSQRPLNQQIKQIEVEELEIAKNHTLFEINTTENTNYEANTNPDPSKYINQQIFNAIENFKKKLKSERNRVNCLDNSTEIMRKNRIRLPRSRR